MDRPARFDCVAGLNALPNDMGRIPVATPSTPNVF